MAQLEEEQVPSRTWITRRLASSPPWVRVAYAIFAVIPLYIATYSWKTPMFTLPLSYIDNATMVGGTSLQTGLAAGQTIGFALGKIPAAVLMSSSIFFRRRYVVMIAIMAAAALSNGLGIALFDSISPLAQAICGAGVSAFFASSVFGGIVSWLEGRRATELLLATLNLAVVLAGGAGRGYGLVLLKWGVAPRWMPLVASGSGLAVCVVALAMLAQLPAQLPGDTEQRGKRGAMSHAQRCRFCVRFAPGIAVSLASYLVVMSLRGFRDFYALELYTEALGGAAPSSTLLFLADAPGGVVACVILALMSRFKRNKRALLTMVAVMIVGIAEVFVSTLLFRLHLIGGVAWLIAVGVGIYTAYLPMGSAFFDRLLAASGIGGTVMLMTFACDGVGYVGTLGLLVWKTAESRGGGGAAASRGSPSALFSTACLYACGVLLVLLLLQALYFAWTLPRESVASTEATAMRAEGESADTVAVQAGTTLETPFLLDDIVAAESWEQSSS